MPLVFHVAAGSVALFAGFLALFVAKGGGLHRRSGRLFVYAMVAMALSGAAIAAFAGVEPSINVPAGLTTLYVVTTALTTLRRRTNGVLTFDRAAMIFALLLGAVCIVAAMRVAAAGGRGAGMAYPLVIFGLVNLLGARGDWRVLRESTIPAPLRMRRHVWRMCFALFVASGSFFLGQADEFPRAIRIPGLLAIPAFLPLAVMLYWRRRLRRNGSIAHQEPGRIAAAWSGWWSRVRTLGRSRIELDEEDFQAEIQSHLAIAAAERMADGADGRAARQASIKEFGNLTLTTEAARRVWTPRWLTAVQDCVSDVRYGYRSLLKNPGFSLTVVAVLTVGIGLNAAVFTMLKTTALDPLSGVAHSSRLHVVYGETTAGRDVRMSYADYRELRDRDQAFTGVLGQRLATVTVGRGTRARQVSAELVTGNYFQVLGVRAQLGRMLLPSDEVAPGAHPVVVLSDRLWRSDFGADPSVVGHTIELNNQVLTVVGVTDPAFHGTIVSYDIELFVPVMMAPQLGFTFGLPEGTPPANVLSDPTADVVYAMGFLRPGATVAAARTQVDGLWTDLSRARPSNDVLTRLRVVPFRQLPGSAQTVMLPLLVVLSILGLLILTIACANVAGLVVVRSLSRRGEVAMRLALGASRPRIIRLLVIENLMLAFPGAMLGTVLMRRALATLVETAETMAAPQQLFFNAETDAMVIGFSIVVACGSALLFGFLPALRAAKVDLVSTLKEETPRGAARGRLRAGLVVAQVAVSLVVLVAAGLMTRSLDAAEHADRGFDATQVTALTIDLKSNAYDRIRGLDFYDRLLTAVRSSPGIESATMAQYMPLSFLDTRASRMTIEGYASAPGEDLAFLSNTVAPGYFSTLRVPLLAGRDFTRADTESTEPVAIVNRTWAERFWGGVPLAIGRRVQVADGTWRTVVGVAADLKYARVEESPRPYVYLPLFQAYRPAVVLHTRGAAAVESLVDSARRSVTALDPNLAVVSANTLERETRGATMVFQLLAYMLFNFGLVGMAMAAIGTYGLVAYAVKQSTNEIGIRMALGASRRSVVTTFVSRGLRLGAIGTVVGVVATLGVSSLIARVLYDVSATDPGAIAQGLATVLGGVVAATVIPAWRASRTNPLTALRRQ